MFSGKHFVVVLLILAGAVFQTNAGSTRRCSTNNCIDDFGEKDWELFSKNGEKKVCYDELMCFHSKSDELSFLDRLPDNPADLGVNFTLYSKLMSEGYNLTYQNNDRLSRLSFLNETANQWVTFVVHGFGSGPHSSWVNDLTRAALDDVGGYVIVVDWSRGSEFPDYLRAVVNTELVGRMTARLAYNMLAMYPKGLSVDRFHFIGHSLGAQMGHFFSKFLRLIGASKPALITALDPAGPEFEEHNVHVTADDAEFVEAIHTSGAGNILTGNFGMTKPVGHVDFYPNGGKQQPGCTTWNFGCSHTRSYQLYIEARQSKCQFVSYACKGGAAQYEEGKCDRIPSDWSIVGLEARQAPGRGTQFFETGSTPPFCKGRSQPHRSVAEEEHQKSDNELLLILVKVFSQTNRLLAEISEPKEHL